MTDTNTSASSVRIERTFHAPVSLVWQMWTDPKHFAAWYGPTGATVVHAEIDLRIGGRRLICMQVPTPAGPRQMWFTGQHREIVEPVLLSYTESMSNENGDILDAADLGLPSDQPTITEIRVEFEELGGLTRMVMTHIGVAADSPGAFGWTMDLDKLGTLLNGQG